MAVDLSAVIKFPRHEKVTLSGTNGKVTQVTLPTDRRLSVSFYPLTTNASLVCDDTIADDAAITTADYPPLNHSQWTGPLRVGIGSGINPQTKIGLVSSTNSQVVFLLLDLARD